MWISVLGICLLFFAVYPLRAYRGLALSIFLLGAVFVGAGYYYFGSWQALQHHRHQAQKKVLAEAYLKKIKDPEIIVQRLKLWVRTHPNAHRGWYLLGRVYASRGEWSFAEQAFQQACRVAPQKTSYCMQYAQAYWEVHHDLSPDLHTLLQKISRRSPQLPDAFALLALEAYQHKNYVKAHHYWEQVLQRLSPDSEAYASVQEALADTERRMSRVPD
ncbi:MAG: hypothetical protein Q8R79_05950 [Legionellaceae bacterium]|nr:hypothetical protein [Legionellaceae bacterium]